ncbi:PH domain-containing protein [Xiamenia xianingshaonis]|uniref:PH domain-containing protein n=1 Tax=Xiamenia xianingshaonis TaxID=2682776 RepID=UPI0021BD9BAD|nr:PH domain-containing protein [Xiamenia xianingshaonis]
MDAPLRPQEGAVSAGPDSLQQPAPSSQPTVPGSPSGVVPASAPAVPAVSPPPASDASAPAVPAALERHRVHHSYIWLGGIKSAVTVLIALLVSFGSSIISVVAGQGASEMADLAAAVGMGAVVAAVVGGACLLGAIVVGIATLCQWWAYRHLYFTLDGEEFTLYSGIFNKKQAHVPYARIQSLDQKATLLQRVFGVCDVSIDTAGGASNKAVVVPCVTKSQAEWLRRELFARKSAAEQESGRASSPAPAAPVVGGQPAASAVPGNILDAPASLWDDARGAFAGARVDTGRVSYEYGLTNGELLLTGFSNNTGFVLVLLGVIGALASMVSSLFDVFQPDDALVKGAGRLLENALSNGGVAAVGVVTFLGACLVLWLLSAIGTCVSYGGFKARRRDSRIEVEYGLLQHQLQGVDIDRVQSVVIRQSFVRRLLGFCEVSLGKIDSLGDQADASQKNKGLADHGVIIHPFVRTSRVPDILAGMVPEFADVPTDLCPVAPVALRRALIRRCLLQGGGLWCLLAGVALFIATSVWQPALAASPDVESALVLAVLTFSTNVLLVAGVVLLVVDAVGAVLWARESSFGYNRSFFQVSNGGLSRETVTVPRKKIQFGFTKTNPFQRRARTATINAATAAGLGTKLVLIDAAEQDAEAWLRWLEPRVPNDAAKPAPLVQEPAPIASPAPAAAPASFGPAAPASHSDSTRPHQEDRL